MTCLNLCIYLCVLSDQNDSAQHQPELSPCIGLPLRQGFLKLKTQSLSKTEIFSFFYIVEVFTEVCCGESECPDYFLCVCVSVTAV